MNDEMLQEWEQFKTDALKAVLTSVRRIVRFFSGCVGDEIGYQIKTRMLAHRYLHSSTTTDKNETPKQPPEYVSEQ
jgi:hypothetical protein